MFAVETGMNYEDIALQKGGPVPLYRQIAAAIRQAIAQGSLAPGERLPPIRTLAHMLSVSQVTTSQAYDQLIAEGAIASHVGRGSFVLNRVADSPATMPQAASPLSAPTLRLPNDEPGHGLRMLPSSAATLRGRSVDFVMEEALRRVEGVAEPIHMSRAAPDPALFPVRRWSQSMRAAGRSFALEDPALLQYGSALGDETLRALLASMLRRHAIHVDANEILLTSGTQQSLDLIARAWLMPGDPVFVEEVSYIAALDILEQRQIVWQALPLDHDGMYIDAFPAMAAAAQARPRLLYTIPTGQSPSGVNLSVARRQALAEMASRYNLLIVADEAFHELYFDGDDPMPALQSYAEPGRVISLVTFNKTIFPGVRMGCIVAARPLIEQLAETKALIDRGASLPLARAVARHISAPDYARELQRYRQEYRQRRDHLLTLLERELAPLECRWTVPGAGFSLLVFLPPGIEEIALVNEAAAQGAIIMPGFCFAPARAESLGNTIRLSYGDLSPDQLEEGVSRLARALRTLRRHRASRGESYRSGIVL